MRRVSSAILIVLILSLASPLVSADSKGIIGCTSADLDMMPASWAISDQSCVTIDFQEVLTPGTTFSFEIDSDEDIDILLFTSTILILSSTLPMISGSASPAFLN